MNTTDAQPEVNAVSETGVNRPADGLALADTHAMYVKDRWLIDNFSISKGRNTIAYNSKLDPSEIIVTEKNNQIVAHNNSEQAAKAVIRIAMNKNWESIRLTGSNEFRQLAWLEASRQGLTVSGYKPTEQDIVILGQLIGNSAERKAGKSNDLTKAFAAHVEADSSISPTNKAELLKMFQKHLATAKEIVRTEKTPGKQASKPARPGPTKQKAAGPRKDKDRQR